MADEKKSQGPELHYSIPEVGGLYRSWQDWLSMWQGIAEEQMLSMTRLSNRLYEERPDPRDWLQEAMRVSAQWAATAEKLSLFPVTRVLRNSEGAPNLVFLLDAQAEAADARELALGVTLGQGVTVTATALRRLGGTEEIDALDRIDLRLSEDRGSLKVALRNLRGDGGAVPPLPHGHYMSVLAAVDLPKRRPLALLHVLYGAA